MNQYIRLYKDIQDMVKILGGRFRHSTAKAGSGTFQDHTGTILVSNKTKNTKLGCFVSLHELGHMVDYLNGKFPKWLKQHNKWISPSLIRKFETSANNFAIQMLKNRKISTKNIDHLDPICFEGWMILYWTLKYNGLSVKNVDRIIEKLYEEAKIPYYWSSRNRRRSRRSGRKNCRS